MTWKAFIREHNAAMKRAERAAARERRELEKQAKVAEAAGALAWAEFSVSMQKNQLELITSLHHDLTATWDCHEVASSSPPPPVRVREEAAQLALASYKPGLFERLIGKPEQKRQELERALQVAREEDARETAKRHTEWQGVLSTARGVAAGNLEAYRLVVDGMRPFEELERHGISVTTTSAAPWYLEAFVTAKDVSVVPREELSVKKNALAKKEMSPQKYWGYYEDYLCSAALRAARELFSILPVQAVLVHVACMQVSTATGHLEPHQFLSVQFDRARLLKLNFARVDPSDAVAQFMSNTGFKKKRQPPVVVDRLPPTQQLHVG